MKTTLQGVAVMAVAFVWFVLFNRFQALYYPEQLQLFQFSMPYFESMMALPGGLTVWLGRFLVQFNVIPWLGAAIYASVVAMGWRLTLTVARGSGLSEKFYAVTFAVPLLMMKCLTVAYFELSYALGILAALAALLIVRRRPRNLWLFAAVFTATYFATAGNVWIMAAGYLVGLFADRRGRRLLMPAAAISALVPVLAWWLCYPVMPKEAFGALTPLFFSAPNPLYTCLWIASLLSGLGWRRSAGRRGISARAAAVNIACAVVVGGAFLYVFHDRHSENVIRMGKLAFENDWEAILETEQRTLPTPVSRALTNLALSHTGAMPYRMFHYRQGGVSELIPSRSNYLMALVQSEVYERLGQPVAAKHSTYEAMVANTMNGDHNSRTLLRLLEYSRDDGDRPLFEKYGAILSRSLFYSAAVERMRESFPEKATMPDTDADFFIGDDSESALKTMLAKNPRNRAAFEYMMAGYLLDRQTASAKRCFDTFYKEFDYPEIPDHWAEMLVLYQHENALGETFYDDYRVPRRIRDDYDSFELMLLASGADDVRERLFEKYRDTYWFFQGINTRFFLFLWHAFQEDPIRDGCAHPACP